VQQKERVHEHTSMSIPVHPSHSPPVLFVPPHRFSLHRTCGLREESNNNSAEQVPQPCFLSLTILLTGVDALCWLGREIEHQISPGIRFSPCFGCVPFSVLSDQFHILKFNSLFKVLFQFSFTVLVCYRFYSII
jgi:hypothetical protein